MNIQIHFPLFRCFISSILLCGFLYMAQEHWFPSYCSQQRRLLFQSVLTFLGTIVIYRYTDNLNLYLLPPRHFAGFPWWSLEQGCFPAALQQCPQTRTPPVTTSPNIPCRCAWDPHFRVSGKPDQPSSLGAAGLGSTSLTTPTAITAAMTGNSTPCHGCRVNFPRSIHHRASQLSQAGSDPWLETGNRKAFWKHVPLPAACSWDVPKDTSFSGLDREWWKPFRLPSICLVSKLLLYHTTDRLHLFKNPGLISFKGRSRILLSFQGDLKFLFAFHILSATGLLCALGSRSPSWVSGWGDHINKLAFFSPGFLCHQTSQHQAWPRLLVWVLPVSTLLLTYRTDWSPSQVAVNSHRGVTPIILFTWGGDILSSPWSQQ